MAKRGISHFIQRPYVQRTGKRNRTWLSAPPPKQGQIKQVWNYNYQTLSASKSQVCKCKETDGTFWGSFLWPPPGHYPFLSLTLVHPATLSFISMLVYLGGAKSDSQLGACALEQDRLDPNPRSPTDWLCAPGPVHSLARWEYLMRLLEHILR